MNATTVVNVNTVNVNHNIVFCTCAHVVLKGPTTGQNIPNTNRIPAFNIIKNSHKKCSTAFSPFALHDWALSQIFPLK